MLASAPVRREIAGMDLFFKTLAKPRVLPWIVGIWTVVARVLMQPGIDLAGFAWIWAVPLLLWAATRPSWKPFLITAGTSIFAGNIGIGIWLRHVEPPFGWLAVLFVAAYFWVFVVSWLALARWFFPKMTGAGLTMRIVIQLGLAGAYVVTEWIQSWLFTGCPWMLLADTQWQVSPVLTFCAWGGPWLLSFVIIAANIGAARYLHRLFVENRIAGDAPPAVAPGPLSVFRNVCPELYVALLPVLAAMVIFFRTVLAISGAGNEPLFSLGVVQTDFDPHGKWTADDAREQVSGIQLLTAGVARLEKPGEFFELKNEADAEKISAKLSAPPANPPDVILWPEAALRFRIFSENYDSFLKKLSGDTGSTLLVGAISKTGENGYLNGIFEVTANGVSPEFYAKRRLVPFGEYVPVPFSYIPGIRQIAPIPEDGIIGTQLDPIPVRVGKRTLRAGGLVCYEDIFPSMSRDMARRGADFIAVVTNDAWYGREAGAYQHASHCAIMAASLQLPVIRCGNNGWSGVFNPLGQSATLRNSVGSIYFRGAGRFDVYAMPESLREPTFYVRNGDWAVKMSGLFLALAYVRVRFRRR